MVLMLRVDFILTGILCDCRAGIRFEMNRGVTYLADQNVPFFRVIYGGNDAIAPPFMHVGTTRLAYPYGVTIASIYHSLMNMR